MNTNKLVLPHNSALIIIDVQKGFDDPKWGKRNNIRAEINISRLLKAWRQAKRPIFHIKNDSTETSSPLRPNLPGNAIKEIVKPETNEPLIIKTVNSAFIGTDLEKRLRKAGIKEVVIVGLTTDHCVSTTARMAGNLGFNTYVVSDATATFDRKFQSKLYSAKMMHDLALASLHNEFATIVTTSRLVS